MGSVVGVTVGDWVGATVADAEGCVAGTVVSACEDVVSFIVP